jgi:steroid 5-alpha reductase family enzyme
MSEPVVVYKVSIAVILFFAVLVFFLLFYVTAPYGKFLREGWGPGIRSAWAWMIMESPSPLLMTFFFLTSGTRGLAEYFFILFWLAHYIHRTFLYPFTQSGSKKSYPVILVIMAFVFNCLNGFVNGFGVFRAIEYDANWLTGWQFLTGVVIFSAGFIINKTADSRLRKLRKGAENGYVVPGGWLFDYISCPHYFGEIIEWGGWAVMTWSLPGLAFFIFTFANLFPRAVASHKWYKDNFPGYPVGRKAVIPFVI